MTQDARGIAAAGAQSTAGARGRKWRWRARSRRRVATVCAVITAAGAAAATSLLLSASGHGRAAASGWHRIGPTLEVSRGCAGQNAEVELATDSSYVYEAWIGCGGIGFARSADGGRSFGHPVTVPGSAGTGRYPSGLPKYGWDPAVAIGPAGTVYVSYMIEKRGYAHPVVAVSADHGRSFSMVSNVMPPAPNNWGDRDFIAVAPDGTLYVTWNYGQSLKTRRPNAVIQHSADGGKTWSGITPVSPGFPSQGGAAAAPLLAEPSGRIDVLFWTLEGDGIVHPKLPNGHDYFTSSADGGRSWTKPVGVQPRVGTIGKLVTWIDVALAIDAAGTLYATWDSQHPGGDIGWLSYSTNHGHSWSAALRVTPDHDSAEHIMAVAGGAPGTAYVGWLSDNSVRGFALYLRPFSVRRGWLSKPVRVSPQFGNPTIWPGDTIGICVQRPGSHSLPRVVLSWGSAVTGQTSQIWSSQMVP